MDLADSKVGVWKLGSVLLLGMAKKFQFFIFAMLPLVLMACNQSPYGGGGQVYRIPFPDKAGTAYTWQNVKIDTYDNPEHFSGALASVLVSPHFDGEQLTGEAPAGHYVRDSEGVMHPSDVVSIQATAVYAHFERIHQLDVQLGVSSQTHWPAKVALKMNISESSGPNQENNAIYDPLLDAILLVPYSRAAPALPIPVNGAVLAHEHFHSLFYSEVLRNAVNSQALQASSIAIAVDLWQAPEKIEMESQEATPQDFAFDPGLDDLNTANHKYNEFLLRAINEGFADFMGWTYLGDDHFVSRSLPEASEARRLDVNPRGEFSASAWERDYQHYKNMCCMSEAKRNRLILGLAYLKGTEYARFLHALALKLSNGDTSQASRLAVARIMVASLKNLGALTKSSLVDHQRLSPLDPLRQIALNVDPTGFKNPSVCSLFQTAFGAQVSTSSALDQCRQTVATAPEGQP